MNANKKVTLQMEGNYPSISSGVIYFRNLRTGSELLIQIPSDLKSYGISSIILDSGASSTVFPENFAEKLDVRKPEADAERYYVFSGVGGLCIAFVSLDRIMVGFQDSNDKLEKSSILLDRVCAFNYKRGQTSIAGTVTTVCRKFS